MKSVDLSNIPKRKDGKIDWHQSIGCNIDFVYYEIKGVIKILDYKFEKYPYIKIQYKNNITWVKTSTLKNAWIKDIIGYKKDIFKFNIGDHIIDQHRDMILTDRIIEDVPRTRKYKNKNKIQNIIEYKRKYIYHCNICGWDNGVIYENNLQLGNGCACCHGDVVVRGINDIATVRPDLLIYFENINDAYTHTIHSNKKVWVVCPYCKSRKLMSINNLSKRGYSCDYCSDNISYPEKFMISFLSQLNIKFERNITSKTYNWCKNYKYDFLIKFNKKTYIIETHGAQHYEKAGFTLLGGRTLEEEQENDKLKKELAIKNNMNYIVLDCRESSFEWMKKSINQSILNEIFDLSDINWLECEKYALSNLTYKSCELWENNANISISEIAGKLHLSEQTIRKYLKQGTKIGICEYTVASARDRGHKKISKSVSQYTLQGDLIKIYDNTFDAENETNVPKHKITHACCHKTSSNHAEGYLWKYTDDPTTIKLPQNTKKKVIKYNKQTLEIIYIYDSISDASKETGISTSAISNCCNGKTNTSGGYYWKFAD